MSDRECLHKTLFFGSGDFYLICEDCGRYWRMEDDCSDNVGDACGLSGEYRLERSE